MDTRKQQTTKARVWTPANIVTLVRILLIPIFVVALLSPWPEWLPYPEFWAASQGARSPLGPRQGRKALNPVASLPTGVL